MLDLRLLHVSDLGSAVVAQCCRPSRQALSQREHADNHWISSRWAEIRKQPGATPDDFLAAIVRGRTEEEREADMLAAADHCLHHLVQGLDRLAVCMAVTAALRVKPLKFHWDELAKFAEERAGKGHELLRQSAAGEPEQQALLSLVLDEPAKHGPTDWLSWLLRARNTATHRPPKTWPASLPTEDRKRPTGLTRPFHRQPGWPEMEAWLSSRGGGAFEIVLNEEPTSTLDGLTCSVSGLVTVLAEQCTSLVLSRRANPSLLVQSGYQWLDYLNEPLLNFPGYGARPKVRLEGVNMHVSPDTGVRMRAFRMLDAQANEWRQT